MIKFLSIILTTFFIWFGFIKIFANNNENSINVISSKFLKNFSLIFNNLLDLIDSLFKSFIQIYELLGSSLKNIVGMMEIVSKDIVDPTQFDKNSKYYDSKSNKLNPRWDCVKVQFLCKSKEIISLQELRSLFKEDELLVVKKGNRLSIIPVPQKSANLLISMLK